MCRRTLPPPAQAGDSEIAVALAAERYLAMAAEALLGDARKVTTLMLRTAEQGRMAHLQHIRDTSPRLLLRREGKAKLRSISRFHAFSLHEG